MPSLPPRVLVAGSSDAERGVRADRLARFCLRSDEPATDSVVGYYQARGTLAEFLPDTDDETIVDRVERAVLDRTARAVLP